MKESKIFSVFCVAFALLMGGFFVQSVHAQVPCDCNGDGTGDSGDIQCLINYLLLGDDPPENPIDCEVDGTPDVNVGDLWQCIGIVFGGADPMPYTGIPASLSDVEFTFGRIRGGTLGVPFDITLDLTDNPGPDLMGIVIAFSYQHRDGHVGVELDNVDFTGTIVPVEWQTGFSIDNDNRRAYVSLWASSAADPALTGGTTGLIARLTFTRTENARGYSSVPCPTDFPPTHTSMIITAYYANGTSPEDRILVPRFFPGLFGDANFDGLVDSGDIIYILNFLFLGGIAP